MENLPLWKLALKASPDSFGLIPAGFSPSTTQVSNAISDDNDLADIMPPNWEKYNYTIENFDSTLLAAYANLKQLFPGVYVNVYNGKRVNSWCGLRTPECTVGAAKSAHKTGEALDLHHGSKLNELRDFCESAEGLKLGIKEIEHRDHTKTWVHIDVRSPKESKWKDKTKPYVFVP